MNIIDWFKEKAKEEDNAINAWLANLNADKKELGKYFLDKALKIRKEMADNKRILLLMGVKEDQIKKELGDIFYG